MHAPILAPAVGLIIWTMIMWWWMYFTRIPALMKAKHLMNRNLPGKTQMDQLPPNVRWKADNYNHLMEQPTLFYATVFALALLEQGGGLNLGLAWAYVALRVAHSLWQALVNHIPVRFAIFTASSLVLMALIFNAARAAF